MSAGSDEFSAGDRFGNRLFDGFEPQSPRAGAVLVSAPDMPDPNFRRTIVYLIEHDDSGSLGVVLTRPSELPVAEILPRWAPLCGEPATFHIGGPVSPDTGIALAIFHPGAIGSDYSCVQHIADRVHVVDLDGDADLLVNAVESMRLFVGYTGWAPGQLAGEIARGDWYVTTGETGDLTAPSHFDVWAKVMSRQPMPLPLYATYIADSLVN